MGELIALAVGLVLLAAALVRAAASPVAWWRFRRGLIRLLTAVAVAVAIVAILINLAGPPGPR